MGVKNLWDILESCKQTLPLHHLQNKRLCVDLSCWLVQLRNASKSHTSVKEKLYLRNLFHRVRALIALNCSLIFVTDGSIPSIKLATYRRRLGAALEVIQDAANAQTAQQPLRRNMGSEFSCMIKEAKELGIALGIPCLDGLEEAEAQCASLNSASLCDGCFTSDSDIFLFGARTVYRDIFLGEGGYVTYYEMADIEKKLGFGRNSLITLALLLGGDYSQGVHGFGPETACRIVKSIGDDTVLHQIVAEGLAFVGKTKGKKKMGKVPDNDVNKENNQPYKHSTSDNRKNPGPDAQFLHVVNAYLNPKCHLPDSEAVQRVYTQRPFLRVKLQQICAQAFGWSPDQTDQYILPKVAERDLRRFANLRSISSELGVRSCLNEIPVPCPVYAILKQRKAQGRECFEISWNEVDGLQSSVVPADLVESACPEKIAEFMEKKVEGKKQSRRPRPRKSAKAAVTEVDLQLQGLLLSIESESNAPNTCKSHHPTGITESQSSAINTSKSHYLAGMTEPQSNPFLNPEECINLSSGSQHINEHNGLSSESQHINECIDLSSEPQHIDLCAESQHINKRIDLSSEPQHIDLSTESQALSVPHTIIQHYPAVRASVESKVIDLSTPSPPLRARKVSKCQTSLSQHVDLINVLESETDTSPEHEKKARELRLFIDSIRSNFN